MNKTKKVTVVLGEEIVKKVANEEARVLTGEIKKLRESSSFLVPPIHITDEIKTDKNNYEIRVEDDTVFKKSISDNKNEADLVKLIVKDIEKTCQHYV